MTETNPPSAADPDGRPTDSQKPPKPPKWRRPLLAILLVVGLVGLGVSLLPDGVRLLAVRFLAEDGKRSAAIESLRFNPFTGLVVIEGLSLVEPDGRGVRVGRLIVDLEMAALIDRQVNFRRLRVENAALDLVRDGPQIRAAGIPAADSSGDEEQGDPWLLGVESLALRDIAVTLHDSAQSEVVTIERVDLSDLAMWGVDRVTTVSLAAKLAQGEVAFAGTTSPLATTRLLKGKLTLGSLDLGRVLRLADPGGKAVPLRGDATSVLDVDAALGPDDNLNVAVTGEISSRRLEFADGFRLAAASLGKIDARFTQGAKGATARLTGSAAIERVAYTTDGVSVEADGFHWDGRLEETTLKGGSGTLSAKGTLTQGKTSIGLKDGQQIGFEAIQADTLDLSAKTDANDGATARVDGGLTVENISVATADMAISNVKAVWQGTLDLQRTATGETGFQANGRFESDGIKASFPAQGIVASQARFRWAGKAGLDPAKGNALIHDGTVAIEGISIDSDEPPLSVLVARSIAADGLTADGSGRWTAERIAVDGIRALASPASVPAGKKESEPSAPDRSVRLDAITARSLTFDGQSRLDVGSVSVDGFKVDLVRAETGEFRLVGSLVALAAKTAGATIETSETQPGTKKDDTPSLSSFAVKDWKIGNGSRLRFIDQSIKPAVTIAIESLEGRLTGVDSARPAADVPISLSSRIGKFTDFEAAGTIRPFSEKLFLDIGGTLRGFELSAITGYARNMLGYHISRGRLDARFKIAINDGKLDGSNELTITKLKVEPGKSREAQAAAASLPLETALSLLRNSKDVIRLDLPVTGDVANPEFDFSDAINQAVAGALKKAVLTTLSLTFPVGGIINVISGAAFPDKLGLKPVSFAPGSPVISSSAGAFLEKVGDMLRERPDVKLTVCGVATPRDREALQRRFEREAEARRKALPRTAPGTSVPNSPVLTSPVTVEPAAMLALSKQRGEAVKSLLVRQQGVKEDRLFLCAPTVDSAANAMPRAEITL